MKVEQFNRTLQRYSQTLKKAHQLRQFIRQQSHQKLFEVIGEMDTLKKGSFTRAQLTALWPKALNDQGNAELFFTKHLPYSQISYTNIVHFIVSQELKDSKESLQDNADLVPRIEELVSLQTTICSLEDILGQKMSRFIPMRFAIPTQEQLHAYDHCYQLGLWTDGIISALNLFSQSEVGPKPQYSLPSLQLQHPSVEGLQRIMGRLSQRVASWGANWQ